ncbi:MAG: hypothetical protein NZM35_07050 [Chitinophagales bacterium]|nr:hypothetical protein [Chitinophagales bacterium]MDW8419241.1 hypothetical protein [Chitinophagales bacterium]
MRAGVLLCLTICCGCIFAQEARFTKKLDKYCKSAVQSFRAINDERRSVLDKMANEMTVKRYVVFGCKTNSRRTVLLQVWAQTAFYYFGLYDRNAFSIGDTVTPVYEGVAEVLSETGFYVSKLANADPNGYLIAISRDYPESIVASKTTLGTLDTSIVLVVNICDEKEPAGLLSKFSIVHLPYASPVIYEETLREKARYRQLNRTIAVEMLYLAYRIRRQLIEKYSLRY